MLDRTALAWKMAGELARARTEGEAAASLARAAALLAEAQRVRVWMMDRTEGYRFAGSWPEEAKRPDKPGKQLARAVAFGAPDASPAGPSHRSRLLLPLLAGTRPMGAIELLEMDRPQGAFTVEEAAGLADLVQAGDAALQAVRERAGKERGQLTALDRLTRLFDVGRSLAATLELSELPHAIVLRVRSALPVDGAYFWLVDDDGASLTVASAEGAAAAAVSGWELPVGEGVAGYVAQTGESVALDDPEEIPGFAERPDVQAGLALGTVAAVPVQVDEEQERLGVLEVVSVAGAPAVGAAELSFLREVASSAALAIGNARRLDAERRAGDLGALLDTAQELGSSLDAQKVAFTLVHRAASILSYRLAAVGVLRGAKLELAAVSGHTFVDDKIPAMRALRDLLTWAVALEQGIYVVREDDGSIDAERAETRQKFAAYFELTGSRSFLTVPLRDDEGAIGVFALEASEPYAFSARALESASLLAAQATVAIRNAMLYQRIPMGRVFRPLVAGRQRFLSGSRPKRAAWIGGLVALTVLLFLVPFRLRVAGEAKLLPERRLPITFELDGRVSRVLVREGDVVEAGQVLAVLDDADVRLGLEDAAARHAVALREQRRYRADGQAAEAAVETAKLAGLDAELALWKTRLSLTAIESTARGLVATPHLEETVGTRVTRGDVFCEVVDPERHRVEVAVPEREVGRIEVGMPIKLKLHAYPTASLWGRVEQIGVEASDDQGDRVFRVTARLERPPLTLRSGMTGRAKIDTGRASLATILLRKPARWLWGVLWGWLP